MNSNRIECFAQIIFLLVQCSETTLVSFSLKIAVSLLPEKNVIPKRGHFRQSEMCLSLLVIRHVLTGKHKENYTTTIYTCSWSLLVHVHSSCCVHFSV